MVRGTRVLAGAFACVGVLGALSAAPAAAQSGFSFTPWAGAYVPTRNQFSTAAADISRDNSFIAGARLTFWGKRPVGLEITGGMAPAQVHISGTNTTINGDRNTQVLVAGAKLMFGLSPVKSRFGIFVSAGPSLIRIGENVASGNASTDWGGVAGFGVRIPFAAAVGLRLDGEDYFYGGQNDLVLSAGLALGW